MRAEHDLVELARAYGAGRLQVLRTVLVPSAVPAFFAGLQISATYAILGAVIAEWVGASSGLGLFITRSQTSSRIDRVFVAVAVIAAVSILLFALVHLLARVSMPCHYARGHTPEETPAPDPTEPDPPWTALDSRPVVPAPGVVPAPRSP